MGMVFQEREKNHSSELSRGLLIRVRTKQSSRASGSKMAGKLLIGRRRKGSDVSRLLTSRVDGSCRCEWGGSEKSGI